MSFWALRVLSARAVQLIRWRAISSGSTMFFVACTLIVGCGEVADAFYPTVADARAKGAVSAGWIPEWIPLDASSLREVHDIDTNESALAFDIPPGSWRTPSHCRPAEGGEFVESKFNRPWLPSGNDLASKYRFFACSDQRHPQMYQALALRVDGAHVLQWTAYAR